jgi:hypothetical protein
MRVSVGRLWSCGSPYPLQSRFRRKTRISSFFVSAGGIAIAVQNSWMSFHHKSSLNLTANPYRTSIMKLKNLLRSLTWNSLFESSRRRRLRRRPTGSLPIPVAAEVLEVRSLLSAANVTASVIGTGITLTSDNNGNHSVDVHRLDASHVEVYGADPGTTINGMGSVVFTLSSVSSIKVNLGNSFDDYTIESAAGAPALNIGAGGIVFQGPGGNGDVLDVCNNSSSPMSILGSITVQGASVVKPLTFNGSSQSEFNLFTNGSGSLSVLGSVLLHEQGTGSGAQYNRIYTNGAGNLNIAGYVTESQIQTDSGYQENSIATDDVGSIAIGLGVTQSATGGTNGCDNDVVTSEPGNIKIGLGVDQTAKCDAGDAENQIFTFNSLGSGNITINYAVTQVSQSSNGDAHNEVEVDGGNLAVGAIAGGISQSATSAASSGDADNEVENFTSGILFSIGGGVTQSASSSDSEYNSVLTNGGTLNIAGQVAQSGVGSTSNGTTNYIENLSSSPLTIGLWATQTGSSTGYVSNITHAEGGSGSLSIGLWLTQTATGSNLSNKAFDAGAGDFKVGTSITQNADSTSSSTLDYVYVSGAGDMTVGAGGILIHESNSSASNDNRVYTHGTGSLSTTGMIIIIANNSGGSSYDSSSNTVQSGQHAGATLSALGIEIVDSGTQYQNNQVLTIGAPMSIGVVGIVIVGSGSGYHANSITADSSNSPITIAGSVTVEDLGSGHSSFNILALANNAPITIGGSVLYYNFLNTASRSDVYIYGNTSRPDSVVTINGSLILDLATTTGTAVDSRGFAENYVFMGGISTALGYGLCVKGGTVVTGGNGGDDVEIREAQLKLGATVNLMGNPAPGSTWHDELEIEGSQFGGGFTAIMTGPNAQIDINNGDGIQPTAFAGLFLAEMTGSNPVIYVAPDTGAGYSSVTFNAGAEAVGSSGAGGQFKYHAANVNGNIIPVFFTKVPV